MRRNLFLYLTLACFVGLLVIFITDGYMGVYDTFNITAGERVENIAPDYWLSQGKVPQPSPFDVSNAYSIYTYQGEKVLFLYAVDNRQFSPYSADIEVSVWRSQEKVLDLIAQPISISAFGRGQVEWTVNSADFLPGNIPEQGYQYTVIIQRSEIERKIVVSVNPVLYPVKSAQPIPAVPPR